ncbi:neutral/alkaline non-lysosomal ceramidase N-terminal domain-containing protein [Candidatus Latescibacterota bacterium]
MKSAFHIIGLTFGKHGALCLSGIALIILMLLFGSCSSIEPPKIKVGVAEKVITPQNPVGVPMSGYARKGPSTGVHDDLYARSLVIEGEDGTSVALITLGIINLSVRYCDEIRAGINKETGIPEDNIVISCTHTHSGAAPYGKKQEEYGKYIMAQTTASVIEAWNSRVPGRIGTGAVEVLELGKNDRRMSYGGLHPDPEAGIIKVENAKGKLIGIAFIYGCHPSTLDLHNLEITEDWPYYSIIGIKEKVGEDVWVAYFQSAQGDVKVGYTAELSAVGADMGIRNFKYAEHKGRMMVEPVVSTLSGIVTSGSPVLDSVNSYADFPLRESYPMTHAEALQKQADAKEKLAEMEKKADTIGKRVLDQYKVDVFLANLAVGTARRVEEQENPKPLTMRRQAVRIGDTVIVTFPNEVFTEIGLKVKQQSPFEKTFVVGLASGHGGYIPTAAEFLEGGYASVMTGFSPKCEKVLIDTSRELISRLEYVEK